MAKVNISIEDMTALVGALERVKSEVDKFGKRGVEDIRECGLKGGPKGKQVSTLADQVELQFNDLTTFVSSASDAVRTTITNYTEWSEADLMAAARQDTMKSKKVAGKRMKL